MISPRVEEAAALAALSEVLGTAGEFRDVGGQAGIHDLDLRLEDGGVLAVEVTGATDAASRQFLSRVESADWIIDSLRQSWSLKLSVVADIRQVRSRLPELLRQLEQAGVQKFDARRNGPYGGVVGQLASLGVLRGSAIGVLDGRQQIFVGSLPALGYVSPDLANAVVADCADRSDNRRKLRAAVASGAQEAQSLCLGRRA